MGALDRIRAAFGDARTRTSAQARDAFAAMKAAIGGGASTPKRGKRAALQGRAIPDQSLWAQFQRIGGALTPVEVSEIIRQADKGYMWRLMDLANEVRQKDCHLQGVLGTSEEAIAELDWELVLPEKNNRRERKAKDFLEDALRQQPGMTRLVAHQAGSRFYGYNVSEAEYEKSGKYLVPEKFVHHSPRRFAFDQATGLFIWRDWNQPNIGVDFRAEWPDKFIVSQPRVTGDVPVREGLVRVLMWAALFRNWTLSDWLKLGEISWKPWRTGTYKKSGDEAADQEDIDNLTAILDGMSASGVAVYPETTSVEVKWAQGAAQKSMHGDLFAVIGNEMSKVVLGQTETTQASKSSGYAQAKVHNEVRKDLRNALARQIAADITRDLLEPMTRLNFGPGVRSARLRFLTEDMADILQFSQGIEKLAGPSVRMAIPATWARKQVGIPEPEKGEEILGPKPGDQLALPGAQPGDKPPPQASDGNDKPSGDTPLETDEEGADGGGGAAEDGGNGGGD